MLSLLKAEYKRLFKSILFYCMLICVIPVVLFIVNELYGINWDLYEENTDYYYTIDYLFTGAITISMFFTVIFTPFFVGTEFSDRVINNKVIAGAKRSHIFLTEFIVSSSAMLILEAVIDIVSIIIVKIALRGQNHSIFDTSYSDMFLIKTCFDLGLVIFCAFCVLLSMSIGSRVKAIIVIIIVYFISNSLSSTIYLRVLPIETQTRIDQEVFGWSTEIVVNTEDTAEREQKPFEETHAEILENYSIVNEKQEAAKGEDLSGANKILYMFLNDALPQNQYLNASSWVFAAKASPLIPRYMVYDVVLIAIILGIGVLVFERKELK